MRGSEGRRIGVDLRRLARTIPLLALVAALAAACGGDASKDEYLDGLRQVKRHLDASAEASFESSQAEDVQVRRAKLGEAHDALDRAATVAEDLEPPSDAAEAHEDFAEALRDYADLYDRLARLEANDPAETELYSEAGDIAERLDASSRRLRKAGYRVPDAKEDDE